MRLRTLPSILLVLAALLVGCGKDKKQPDFPDLSPVKGVVTRAGNPVNGGVVRFVPNPDKPEFLINAEVGPDGKYTLTTVRTTDSQGEHKTGAPPGTYKVTYTPQLGDQSAGGQVGPMDLPKTVTVAAGDNDIPIEVPKK